MSGIRRGPPVEPENARASVPMRWRVCNAAISAKANLPRNESRHTHMKAHMHTLALMHADPSIHMTSCQDQCLSAGPY